ncbi:MULTISPECIES: DNA-deoxyinosine glycosylase [unclassified Campylobacter]|uniref:DNA-deoxyinosine glycosylase n=1 Tax=unclassified Campylobacter TaxID=2593542 RepID=UPI0014737CFA|nr:MULTISPECIES: DNA-deoxyinosine glycosylase [unclassified Campylobacter]
MNSLLTHPFKPIFDKNSKILILGSFPSVASREQGFYYANPQNRFWRVLAAVLDCQLPKNTDEKIELLIKHKIAIYDAALVCEITGSSDAKMTKIGPSNLEPIFEVASISQVFTNGNKAYEISKKFQNEQILKATKKEIIKLPSTSPANAKFSLERLLISWSEIGKILI